MNTQTQPPAAGEAANAPTWHRIVSVTVAEYYGPLETEEAGRRWRAGHPQSQSRTRSATMDDAPKNPEDLILACKSHAPLSRAWSELAFHANELANAKTKLERDRAALKVFTAIGNAKDALPELRTLSEVRAALQSAKE